MTSAGFKTDKSDERRQHGERFAIAMEDDTYTIRYAGAVFAIIGLDIAALPPAFVHLAACRFFESLIGRRNDLWGAYQGGEVLAAAPATVMEEARRYADALMAELESKG